MSKTHEHYREDIDGDDEYRRKRQEEEDQYYMELMEQTDIDITDCTEEELFNQILRDEREESLDQKNWHKIMKEIKKK